MTDRSGRRDFFRGMLRDARHAAGSAYHAYEELRPRPHPGPFDADEPREPDTIEVPGVATPPSTAPPVPQRCLSYAELFALARDHGLGHRVEQIADLARISARLVPAPGTPARFGSSRAGGRPALPDEMTMPGDRRDSFMLQLDLAEIPAEALGGCLPRRGLLLLFVATDRDEEQGRTKEPHASVAIADEPSLEVRDLQVAAGVPLSVHAELVLPRVWAAPVQDLDLDTDESAAWAALRLAVAAGQGTAVADASTDFMPFHRVGGYADETTGTMPTRSDELRAQRLGSVVARDDRAHQRWQLLVQLSTDPAAAGWDHSGGTGRLYIWSHHEDLGKGAFNSVQAFAR